MTESRPFGTDPTSAAWDSQVSTAALTSPNCTRKNSIPPRTCGRCCRLMSSRLLQRLRPSRRLRSPHRLCVPRSLHIPHCRCPWRPLLESVIRGRQPLPSTYGRRGVSTRTPNTCSTRSSSARPRPIWRHSAGSRSYTRADVPQSRRQPLHALKSRCLHSHVRWPTSGCATPYIWSRPARTRTPHAACSPGTRRPTDGNTEDARSPSSPDAADVRGAGVVRTTT
jgi:hypothetical protein